MKNSRTLFYLDDDYEDLDFFREVAEDLGHNVRVFAEGRIMLLVLETEVEKPDIIFLDVHMPILNGQEILEIIKKSDTLKKIPIVMVSGAYPKKLVRHFSDLGVNYLMKKHHVHDYRESLEEVLNAHLASYKTTS
ncbi:response regulator [Flavobacterium terrisoli]|uniref:response regulator n=1 Tax=Flavobacterium terrisoli TaxID=3242195 RepID=UPI002543BAFB|nr:response regulator [Flavobacterium buctense]